LPLDEGENLHDFSQARAHKQCSCKSAKKSDTQDQLLRHKTELREN